MSLFATKQLQAAQELAGKLQTAFNAIAAKFRSLLQLEAVDGDATAEHVTELAGQMETALSTANQGKAAAVGAIVAAILALSPLAKKKSDEDEDEEDEEGDEDDEKKAAKLASVTAAAVALVGQLQTDLATAQEASSEAAITKRVNAALAKHGVDPIRQDPEAGKKGSDVKLGASSLTGRAKAVAALKQKKS